MDMDDPRVKSQIGFLPEQPYFYDHLTARELLNYYGQLSGVPAKGRSARVEQMLGRVGLSDSAGVQLRKFSKGMLQRVGLAQAILHDPKLVFLDEPMSGLDPMGRREVRDLIQQLRNEGKTVFFSTHILSDAEALCDRVGIIHRGALRGVGAVAELTSATQGKVEIIFYARTVPAALTSLGAEARVSGDMVNAVLAEEQQDAALEVLRREHLKLISLAPVRSSLEEYYVQKLRPTEAGNEAKEKPRKPERGGRMNSRIGYIAFNTFREAVRDRVLYNLIAFALLLSGAAILVGEISIDIERLVVVNLGLTAVSLFGVVIAIFIGIGLVSKEIDKRTLYTVLSRPVRRWEFVVGKFFGLTGTLVVNTFFMAFGVFLALLYVAHKFEKMDAWVLVALYFIVLQFFIVCALALFFSSFSTPLMAAVFTFALFVIGSLSEDLRGFARVTTGAGGWLARAIAYLVPNFSALNVITQVAHGDAIPGRLILYNTVYALLYSAMAISGAVLIFQRRNLK